MIIIKESRIDKLVSLRRFLTAGGTARLFQWLMKGPFAILSAEKGSKTTEQNEKDTEELKKAIIQDGFGFYPANGFYAGVPEDSIFVPEIPLERAVMYGRMFKPIQDTVLWGKDGAYAFYSCEDGGPTGQQRSVKKDFTILNSLEAQRLVEEKAEIGFTKVKRDTRPWTVDPSIGKWREKTKEQMPEAEERKMASRYLIMSDPRKINAMGNFQKVVKAVKVDGRNLCHSEGRSSFVLLLAALPWD
jgi:hypothetical protein